MNFVDGCEMRVCQAPSSPLHPGLRGLPARALSELELSADVCIKLQDAMPFEISREISLIA